MLVHSSVIYTAYPLSFVGKLEPIPAGFGKRQGTPWAGHQSFSGLRQRQTTIHTYIHTYGEFRVAS